ncbi:hypothetical protein BDD12DRAFT_56617 [Trichophaea hybrida]|nr:hypothetical protein BDD12DRAFT_56617 [Trichophaea hybrida]
MYVYPMNCQSRSLPTLYDQITHQPKLHDNYTIEVKNIYEPNSTKPPNPQKNNQQESGQKKGIKRFIEQKQRMTSSTMYLRGIKSKQSFRQRKKKGLIR